MFHYNVLQMYGLPIGQVPHMETPMIIVVVVMIVLALLVILFPIMVVITFPLHIPSQIFQHVISLLTLQL